MKKLLAMLLSASVLAGLLGAVSIGVAAMGENEGYPLMYETYESEAALASIESIGSNGTLTISEGGVNGSAGALHLSQTTAGKYVDIRYDAGDAKISKGQQVEVSYWIKLNAELKTDVSDANRISLIFYGPGTVSSVGSRTDVAVGDTWTGNGWKQYDVSNKMVKGEWVKIEQSFVWDNAMSIGSGAMISDVSVRSIALRVANLNGANAVVDGAPLDYEIDDFVIRYPEPEEESSLLARADFDSSSTTGELDGRSEDCSLPYQAYTYTADQVDTSLGFIKDKQPNARLDAVLSPGHMYKISGWYRVDADEAATDFTLEKAQVRMIFMNKDKTDANFGGGNYPSYYTEELPIGQWTKIEYYFYMDWLMYTTNPGAYLWMRICPSYTYQGGDVESVRDHIVPGTYSFDNLQVEDLGSPANGDFELDTETQVVRNFSNATSPIPGWYTSGNAEGELAQDGSNHYMKYTTLKEHGNFQTVYPFLHDKTYKISFRAKTEGLEAGETKPLTLILDRKVSETGTNDSYTVPNYEYLIGDGREGGSSAAQADHPWQLTNEWQAFTTTYTTDSRVIEGMEVTAATVNPRAAMIYFFVDSTGPAGSVLCLDDLVIEEVETRTVDNISFRRSGNAVQVNYDYLPQDDDLENKAATLIRAYIETGDVETNIGTFAGNETFNVPVLAMGKQISFEIIPVSQAGIIGKAKSAVCSEIFDLHIEKSLKVAENYESAAYDISLYSAKGAAQSYAAALAAYDGSGRLIDLTYDALTVNDGASEFGNTLAIPAAVEKVKLMILESGTFRPITDAVEEILPAVNANPFAGDDEINVVFLGDSIYAGNAATKWVPQVGEWFRETYEDADTAVNWYNKGVGGTTSHYSLVRVQRDVISLNPDVVFFAITSNDGSTDTRREMESVIRSLMDMENPPYVVMTFFTSQSWRASPGYGDAVAAHYGIPLFNNTEAMKADIAATGNDVSAYYTDGTHLTAAGDKVIADAITAWLASGRSYVKPVAPAEKLVANSVSVRSSECFNASDETKVVREGSWTAGTRSDGKGYLHSTQEGDTLSFYFDGNFIAFEHGLHMYSGRYEVRVDDELILTGNPYYNNITSYQLVCKGDSTYIDLAEDGPHAVEITTIASSNSATTSDTYSVRLYDILVGSVER